MTSHGPWLAEALVRRDPDACLITQREDLDMPLMLRYGLFE
jgi:hypothetical protein